MTAAASDAAEHNRLGLEAGRRGDLQAAEAHFRAAVEHDPGLAQAHNNLGVSLEMQGRVSEAAGAYQQALAARPDYVEAYHNLGVACTRLRQYQAAVDCCRKAIALRPDYLDAYNGLGVALQHLEQYSEAADCLKRVVAARPDFAPAHSNLAAVLEKLGEFDAAVAHLQRALALEPRSVAAHVNLAMLLKRQRHTPDAERMLRKAIELDPTCGTAHVNLGSLFERDSRFSEAEQVLERALELDPNCAEAHMSLAVSRFRRGDFVGGAAHYLWRNRLEGRPEVTSIRPRWDGSPLSGRTILVCEDQGAGDNIQFIRYAQLLAEQGGRVLVHSRPRLATLFETCPGVHEVIRSGDPLPHFDLFTVSADLPGLCRTTLATIPASVPYLFADESAVAAWRDEWRDVRELKVGIAWQGDPQNTANSERSVPLSCFAPLAEIPGVRLYSLQFGHGREQLATMPDVPITDLGDRLGDFQQTAAVLRNLDLVITCDSSPAHLAGAVGVPVWVALAQLSDWRWMLERSDSPWYPSMRLFRQQSFGNWPEVFERIAESLAIVAQRRDDGG